MPLASMYTNNWGTFLDRSDKPIGDPWRGPFSLMPDPTTCPGGYTVDVYCDHSNPDHIFEEFPHSFYAETGGAARKQARRSGWKLHDNGTATCPKCMKRLRNGNG